MNDKQLQLVTFNQAVKLKAIGFNWPTYFYYEGIEESFLESGNFPVAHNLDNNDGIRKKFIRTSAPTVSHALKWMRDKKGLHAFCDNKYHGWHYEIYSIGNDAIRIDGNELQIFFETYEEAESALLDELLMLIENEK